MMSGTRKHNKLCGWSVSWEKNSKTIWWGKVRGLHRKWIKGCFWEPQTSLDSEKDHPPRFAQQQKSTLSDKLSQSPHLPHQREAILPPGISLRECAPTRGLSTFLITYLWSSRYILYLQGRKFLCLKLWMFKNSEVAAEEHHQSATSKWYRDSAAAWRSRRGVQAKTSNWQIKIG